MKGAANLLPSPAPEAHVEYNNRGAAVSSDLSRYAIQEGHFQHWEERGSQTPREQPTG
jgi:hypothetical protein